MIAWSWETAQMLTAALAPLVAVPLGVITFYLRSLYENQSNRHAELVRRFELVERMSSDLAKAVSGFALDYTTKEEWLRECMYARGRIERLTEMLARHPHKQQVDWEGEAPAEPRSPRSAFKPPTPGEPRNSARADQSGPGGAEMCSRG